MKTTTLPLRNSVNRSHVRLAFLLIPLACFALSPHARADCQEGCDTINMNTFLGEDALLSHAGCCNTAIGWSALTNNFNASWNTAVGSGALEFNTLGDDNTAIGVTALEFNTSGSGNTATGRNALEFNTTGNANTAMGNAALLGNKTGNSNVADGGFALGANRTGRRNTATGYYALSSNTAGGANVAMGYYAGANITGNNNIDIGNSGVAGESTTIRIGDVQTATYIAGISGATVADGVGVIVGADGHLGTVVSSQRYKDAIKPMDKASEAILALKPVTFRYKHELDPAGIPQFGLVAEDVEKVNPDLVARDEQGKPYTVRYEAVNAMLLNEFLKEHRKVEKLEATVGEQQQEIKALTASLKEQALQIQKVNDRLATNKPAMRLVDNNR
jgi:trimeric autotransporter adhesin